MSLTRCPNAECQTTFRVTPEQLSARGGKVRCGQCQQVFNALEHLIETETAQPLLAQAPSAPADHASSLEAVPQVDSAAIADFDDTIPEMGSTPELADTPAGEDRLEPVLDLADQELPAEPDTLIAEGATPPPVLIDPEDPILPRETTAIPGYSKWAESPLAGGVPLMTEPARRPAWPFALAITVLAVALLAQMGHHFRSDLVIALPSLRPALTALGWDIPLPRQADLVSIEASDLQADGSRNQLVLQATLKNRAAYGQDLPALELALTDANDGVLSRRVFLPAEYLTDANAAFPANGEIAVRLWIEARELAPAGYRLYVFYP